MKKPKWQPEYEMYMTYCLLIQNENPTTFEEATQTREWKQAIEEEGIALENQRTWKVAKLLKEKTAIETRWVFATKENGRKKASLVVKEFQVKKDRYQNTCPCRKLIHHTNAERRSRKVHLLESDIFIKIPKYLQHNGVETLNLKKVLYGLKESPMCWNNKFDKFINELGFL